MTRRTASVTSCVPSVDLARVTNVDPALDVRVSEGRRDAMALRETTLITPAARSLAASKFQGRDTIQYSPFI